MVWLNLGLNPGLLDHWPSERVENILKNEVDMNKISAWWVSHFFDNWTRVHQVDHIKKKILHCLRQIQLIFRNILNPRWELVNHQTREIQFMQMDTPPQYHQRSKSFHQQGKGWPQYFEDVKDCLLTIFKKGQHHQ